MKRFILPLLLAGCTAQRSPPPPPPAPPPPAVTITLPPVLPPPAVAVAQQYKAVAQREIDVVTSPSVTPEFVHAVREADRQARTALAQLERRNPPANALDNAREAVRHLDDVVSAAP